MFYMQANFCDLHGGLNKNNALKRLLLEALFFPLRLPRVSFRNEKMHAGETIFNICYKKVNFYYFSDFMVNQDAYMLGIRITL